MTDGIMQSDHMALRSPIDDALNSNDIPTRDNGELAKIEFDGMMEEIADAHRIIHLIYSASLENINRLAIEETGKYLSAHPEAKP